LDWHRREEKAIWWEYFRLSALSAEDLLDERAAISGLTLVGAVGGTANAPIHRYSFPIRDTQIRGGEQLHSTGGAKLGTVVEISLEQRTVENKKRGKPKTAHSEAAVGHEGNNSKVLAEALLRIGRHVADHGIEGDGSYRPARNLLLRTP